MIEEKDKTIAEKEEEKEHLKRLYSYQKYSILSFVLLIVSMFVFQAMKRLNYSDISNRVDKVYLIQVYFCITWVALLLSSIAIQVSQILKLCLYLKTKYWKIYLRTMIIYTVIFLILLIVFITNQHDRFRSLLKFVLTGERTSVK